MKLYNVPRNSKIRILSDDSYIPPNAPQISQNEILTFKHIDGMYSYCINSEGAVVHLAAWEDVEIVEEAPKRDKVTEADWEKVLLNIYMRSEGEEF